MNHLDLVMNRVILIAFLACCITLPYLGDTFISNCTGDAHTVGGSSFTYGVNHGAPNQSPTYASKDSDRVLSSSSVHFRQHPQEKWSKASKRGGLQKRTNKDKKTPDKGPHANRIKVGCQTRVEDKLPILSFDKHYFVKTATVGVGGVVVNTGRDKTVKSGKFGCKSTSRTFEYGPAGMTLVLPNPPMMNENGGTSYVDIFYWDAGNQILL